MHLHTLRWVGITSGAVHCGRSLPGQTRLKACHLPSQPSCAKSTWEPSQPRFAVPSRVARHRLLPQIAAYAPIRSCLLSSRPYQFFLAATLPPLKERSLAHLRFAPKTFERSPETPLQSRTPLLCRAVAAARTLIPSGCLIVWDADRACLGCPRLQPDGHSLQVLAGQLTASLP